MPVSPLPLDRPVLAEPVGGRHARAAAVLGSPISHSRSPDLHLAAYRALGLADWTYVRTECTADTLPTIVRSANPAQVGFSVTMPAKLAALGVADERTPRAVLVGSANTLVRTETGWRADNTDIDGMTGALAALGVLPETVGATLPRAAVVVGAGGTALPTVAALVAVGVDDVTVVARSADRARGVLDLADRLGVRASLLSFASDDELTRRCAESAVTVSTAPAAGAAAVVGSLSAAARVVDVIYDPWPTPLAAAVTEAGGRVVGGLVMLLNQAFSQVEQFTGYPAPREAMAAVIGAAAG
ncbi:shikimate dehydrogenase [Gordonia sp. NPDC003950]